MPTLVSGQKLSARYTVRERLSATALSETWRAHDEQLDRGVIVKVLREEFARSPAALDRLRAEIDAAQRLNHPGLAAGYALENDSGASGIGVGPFVVRSYIDGRDLSSLRTQPWRIVLPAAVGVAEAVAAMHAAGLVHRDVKASNVIVAPDGSVRVIDLGLASASGNQDAPEGGSPYSQSPQQLSGEAPTAADDIYAFGALLYELLGGYPPFYPNFNRERVLSEVPARLRPAQPAPEDLLDLVMRMLEKDPAQRPQTLAEVGDQLRGLLAKPDDATLGTAQAAAVASGSPASIIRPIVRTGERAVARQASAGGGLRTWVIGIAMTVLAALVVGVFVVLPKYSVKPTVAQRPVAPVVEQPKAPEAIDYEAMAVEMDKAEQAQGAFDATFKGLSDKGATQWATEPFLAAKALGEQAKAHFGKREFPQAREAYKQGLEKLQAATDESARVVERELARGAAALQAGQSATAREAFELVRRIDPQNAVAARGAGRATTLDQVIALTTSAANDERDGQLTSAEQKFKQAADLDRDMQSAADGLTRVRARIAGDSYAAAMSAGLAHLNAGRLSEARAAISRAGQIRPGASEVKDALAQVAQAGDRRTVEGHRAAAESAERAERWDQALAEYDSALKVDSTLEFARAGRDRVTPRLELAKALEVHIQKPERLTSAAVRSQALEQLAQAQKIASPGPVLSKQVAQVKANIQKVESPVRIALESDNATVVVIHRVGPLGAFERREIDLLPGKYTVVGSRMGFRDVRRELDVHPGDPPPPLLIRCEERI